MTRLIILEGWPAAGKSTLWALLAGHKDVFVEPLHTYFYEAAFYLGLDENPKRFTLREIRKSLAKTEYYKTEQYALAGEVPIHFGADKIEHKHFIFDWYKFDRLFISEIVEIELTFDSFIDKYLSCYQKGLGKPEREYKYFLTMSNYYNAKVVKKKSEKLNFLVLIAHRSYKEIISSRVQRSPRKEDGDKFKAFAPKLFPLLISGEVEKIEKFYRQYKRCQNAKFVNIPMLIGAKIFWLKKITDWLELDELDQPHMDYFLDDKLSNKYSFSMQINDDVKFTLLELSLLHFHKMLSYLFPFGAFILNPKSLIELIYKNWVQSKMHVK